MDSYDIEAVVGGYHSDPFRVLGPHEISEGQWEVRAFLPHAVSVEVVSGKTLTATIRRHSQGFFVAGLTEDPGDYRLRVRLYNGSVVEIDDPYRFPPLLSPFDLHLHSEGTLYEGYRMFGSHRVEVNGVPGVRFAVWAPNALVVSVVGDFNEWDTRRHPMRMRDGGVWELFLPHIPLGTAYKYSVRSRHRGHHQLKSDPYGFYFEVPPKSASLVWDLDSYEWKDTAWLTERGRSDLLQRPVSIYEVHSQSWMRGPQHQVLTYREMAETLVPYVQKLGYTHIELLPIMEHPYSGSWGYQVVGYFAPTSRHGTPQDFKYLVDQCHQAGIGVIVDWVPAHFPKDAHGLAYFDGTALYEHEDPRKGEHRDWGTLIFNFGRHEVQSFLISNALFWLKEYHIDGLRVDAVASMLYLDYSRKHGEWVPNVHGGNENLEAIDFLRRFNELAHAVPGAVTIAEESTAFPGVSKPVYLNGLGFTMKWNMGWMHDMLGYFEKPSVFRQHHQNSITFSIMYAFTENFVLPISHDEVVYGKRSLLDKMPGDEWQKFANARAFLAYMYTHPGKKLLFMGAEIGQYEEWNANGSVRWELLQYDLHRQLQATVVELNNIYRREPALYEDDFHYTGFEWVDFHDYQHSVIVFLRFARNRRDYVLVCCNFTPVPRTGYGVGVPEGGLYREIFNSDAAVFGGSNVGNAGYVMAEAAPQHGREHRLTVTLPPLGVVIFKPDRSLVS